MSEHRRTAELDEKLFELNDIVTGLKDGKGGLRFDHSAEEINRMTDDLLAHQQGVVDRMVSVLDTERNFENVVLPFAIRESNAGTVGLVIGFYADLASNETVREAGKNGTARLLVQENTMYGSRELYQAFQDVKTNLQKSGEWSQLEAEDRMYVNKILREFIQDGILLTEHQRLDLAALQKRSDELQIAAYGNLEKDHSKVEVSPEEMEGMPE